MSYRKKLMASGLSLSAVTLGLVGVGVAAAPAAQAATCKVAVVADIAGSDDYTTGANKTGAQIQAQNVTKAILPGDLAYTNGTLTEFNNYFNPGYGPLKTAGKLIPVPGNHEYNTSGAGGFKSYFGSTAVGNHAQDVCGWRVITVDEYAGGGSTPNSTAINAGASFIRSEAAAHPTQPIMVSWHAPRYSSGLEHGNDPAAQPLWQAAVDVGARLVLNGHDHDYERFAPMNGSGAASSTGPVEIVSGKGGHHQRGFASTIRPNSVKRDSVTPGVLYLTLSDADDSVQGQLLNTDNVVEDTFSLASTGTTTPPPPGPAAPACLVATASTTRTVALDWDDVPGATSYEVREDLFSADHTVATVTASNRTSGALSTGTYRYYVLAKNANGSSVASPKVTISTATGVTSTAEAPTGCDATEQPPAGPTKPVFKTPIEDSTVSGTITMDVTAPDAQNVKYYVDGVFVAEDPAPPNWPETWDTTTVTDGPHTIVAKATNSSGTTDSDPLNVIVDNGVNQVTPAPVLTGSLNSTNQSVLDWNDIPGATYNVYEPNGTPGGPVATGLTTSSRTSPTLKNGTYDYSVTAVVNGVESERSNVIHLVVGGTNNVPAAPTLSGSINSSNQSVLNWTAVSGATYNVYEPNGTPNGPVASGLTGTSRTSPALPNGTYDYSVTSVVNGVESARSNVVHLVVGSTPPVTTAPTASFNATGADANGNGVAPLTVRFTDTSTGSPTSWEWDFGDGTSSSLQNPSHTYDTAGDFQATLTATNAAGSTSASRTFHVTVPTPEGTLRFKPVPLVDPITVNVTTGNVFKTLDRTKDYIVKLPANAPLQGGLWLDGGHNVQIIGGAIEAPGNMAFKIKNNTGDFYMEGVQLGGSGTNYATEGIQICSPTQTSGNITIQNVKVNRVVGSEATNHADIVQYYCGHSGRRFRLVNLDGMTTFQGVIFQPDNASGGTVAAEWYMRDVILRRPGTTGGVLINVTNDSPSAPRTWQNVVLVSSKSNEVELRGQTETGWTKVSPSTNVPSVLQGNPGVGYVSPGYLNSATY